MDKIYDCNLMKYDENCSEHKKITRQIKDYRFDINYEILREITANEYLCESNTTKLVGTGNQIFVRCSKGTIDKATIFLIDAYNVYTRPFYSDEFVRDIELSKKWRNLMKKTYPASWYTEDAHKFLQEERRYRIDDINADIDEQIESL